MVAAIDGSPTTTETVFIVCDGGDKLVVLVSSQVVKGDDVIEYIRFQPNQMC